MALVQPPQHEYIIDSKGRKRRYWLRVCDNCGEEKYVQIHQPNSTYERCLSCHNKRERGSRTLCNVKATSN